MRPRVRSHQFFRFKEGVRKLRYPDLCFRLCEGGRNENAETGYHSRERTIGKLPLPA
ncbi:MAG: hypothetical protein DHS20C06_18020 [Hyphobacterium sp.]|nr:MAG: hypothetical protein DHS20C06_18020 [Hyphobacterium sp.]